MNGVQQAMPSAPDGVAAEKPDLETRLRSGLTQASENWLCAACLNRVACEKDRCSFEGKSEFTFKNPEGIAFNLVTFSQTLGCQQAGAPSLDHTWFPGHAWSYCLCGRCLTHLGWFYSGPSEFAGFIRERIVPAASALN